MGDHLTSEKVPMSYRISVCKTLDRCVKLYVSGSTIALLSVGGSIPRCVCSRSVGKGCSCGLASAFVKFRYKGAPTYGVYSSETIGCRLVRRELLRPTKSRPSFAEKALRNSVTTSSVAFCHLRYGSRNRLISCITRNRILSMPAESFNNVNVFTVGRVKEFCHRMLVRNGCPRRKTIVFKRCKGTFCRMIGFLKLSIGGVKCGRPTNMECPARGP